MAAAFLFSSIVQAQSLERSPVQAPDEIGVTAVPANAEPVATISPNRKLAASRARVLESFKAEIDGLEEWEKIRNEPSLLDSFNFNTQKARVIVLLDSDGMTPEGERFITESSRAAWRSAVAGQQTRVIRSVSSSNCQIKTRYQNIPGFACEVNADGMRDLLANPEVVAVQADTLEERHLAQGIPLMNATSVRSAYDGTGMTIAIIDDGVDYTHPNLGGGGFPNSKVIGGIDTAGVGDANPFPGGGNSHGTSVAGIACGTIPGTITTDYIGGMAPAAKIAAVKVFADGAASAFSSDVIEGIDWCVTNQFLDPVNPIMIINMSLGGGKFTSAAAAAAADPVRLASLNAAVAAGITVIASSGNDGFCDSMGVPAALAPAISVGAVYDANIGNPGWCVDPSTCYPGGVGGLCGGGDLAIFESSAAEKVTAYSNTADFLDVFGASNNAFTPVTGGGFTAGFGGTSAAAPYVSGSVALLQSAALAEIGNFLSPEAVRTILTSTGIPVTDTKGGGLAPGVTKPLADTEAAILSILSGDNLQDIAVSDPSLTFIMDVPAMDSTDLTIENEAGSGGFSLSYSIDTSVQGSEVDTVGAAASTFLTNNAYIGNVYECTAGTELTLIESYLSFAGTQNLTFSVYVMDVLSDAALKTQVYSSTVSRTSVGAGFYASNPLSLQLIAGKFYVIAVGWGAPNITFYYNGTAQPAVSFGQKRRMWFTDYPLPAQFTGGLGTLEFNTYQRLTAGAPNWLSATPDAGLIAPQMGDIITVSADATGLAPGTYEGNLAITSNDPDASMLSIPVGLRVGLLGQVYVQFDYAGVEFGTMAEPYNTLGEGHEAVAPGPAAQITIVGGGSSNEVLDLDKEVTITTTGGEATVGGE